MDFKKSMKINMKRTGMQPGEIADKSGLGYPTVIRVIETGCVSMKSLEKLAKVFGKKPSELIADGEE